MNASFIKLYQEIRSSYWFIPTAMAIGAILLSLFTNHLDVSR